MIPHGGFTQIDGSPYTFLITSSSGTVTGNTYGQVFEIPNWSNMVHIIAVGAGGGGGAGALGTTGSIGGGGGGASGGVLSVMYPTFVLPRRLFITLGVGGVGGAPGSINGTGGSNTFISTNPSIAIGAGCVAYAIGGNGGAGGSTTIGGAGGIASTNMANIQTNGTCPYVSYGYWSSRNTLAGTTGGFNSVSSDASFAFVSGGTGGGSLTNPATEFAAGQINVGLGGNGTGTQPHSGVYSINPVTSQASDGAHGIISYKPLYFTGGIGGKAYAGGRGGTGGNGAPGCGGGGSGASASGSVQVGGKGGDGFVVISCW